MKRNISDVWKENGGFYVQFPKGKMFFKTKKVALKWAEQLKKEYKENEAKENEKN